MMNRKKKVFFILIFPYYMKPLLAQNDELLLKLMDSDKCGAILRKPTKRTRRFAFSNLVQNVKSS